MRALKVLPLLLVIAVAGLLSYYLWLTPSDWEGIEGPISVEAPVKVDEDRNLKVSEGPVDSGGRTEVETATPTGESAAPTGLSREELERVDANALVGRVVDAEGNGIPGCEVTFIEGGLQGLHALFGAQLEIEGAPRIKTNADGEYGFLNLEPGEQHALRVRHPEISMRFIEGVTVADFGVTEEPPILLVHGKRVRGVVTNELDVPIEGAQLHLDGQWRPSDPQASHDRLSAVTDAEGKYEIFGVPDGTRCLTAVASGLGQATRIQSLIFSDATGQAHVVNMKLLGAAPCKGRVTDLAGNGIAGVDVLAVDRSAYRDVNNDRVTTGPDGSFSFEHLARGTYQITARAPGYKPVIMKDVVVPRDGLNILFGERRMLNGMVLDARDGTGIASFNLQLLQHQGGAGSTAVPRGLAMPTQSTGDGRFSLPLTVSPGLWRLQATVPGFAVSVSEPFQIGASGNVDDILISMNQGGTIRGMLLDGEGQPVVGGRITSRDNAWTDDAFSQLVGGEEGHAGTVLEVRSGRDGAFVLPNLRVATYQLIARSGKHHQKVTRDLAVAEGETLDVGVITMVPGGGLHGTLFDAEGTPVPGGMVFLNPARGNAGATVRRVKSGFNGRWELKNIAPGEYTLSGQAPGDGMGDLLGFWPSGDGEPLQIASGVRDLRDVHLSDWTLPKPPEPEPPTGQLSGNLTNAAGVALVGHPVQLTPVSQGASPAVLSKTAREGAFTFLKLLPGDYDLSVPDQPESTKRVTIQVDAWTHQDLVSAE